MKTNLQHSNLLYIGLVVLYLLLQLFLINQVPDIMEDEPWYANTAYNFSQGNWFTNTNTGHQGGDFFILYTFILGIAIKLFGCTLYVTRMVSVLAGIIALWGLISILKKFKSTRSVIFLTSLFFIFSNVNFIVFRTARPESWILAFGIWSIYFLLEFHRSKQAKKLIWTSVFASLAFFLHPNGIFFLIVSGLYLLVNAIKERKISNIIYFGLIALGLTILHFTIAFLNPNISFSNFINDLGDRNSLTDTSYTIADNIKSFFTSYTLGIKRLYILFFEIGILLWGLVYSKREVLLKFIPMFGLVVLVLSLTLLSPYSSRHFGEVLLFSFLSFALLISTVEKKKIKILLMTMASVYLLNNIAGDMYIVVKKFNNTPYSHLERKLAESIPDNSVVVASIHHWYPLKDTEYYSEFTAWRLNKTYPSLDFLLQSGAVDYIVITNALVEGRTGTSGRTEKVPGDIMDFFLQVSEFSKANGTIIESIPTVGYDTISVYKMK